MANVLFTFLLYNWFLVHSAASVNPAVRLQLVVNFCAALSLAMLSLGRFHPPPSAPSDPTAADWDPTRFCFAPRPACYRKTLRVEDPKHLANLDHLDKFSHLGRVETPYPS